MTMTIKGQHALYLSNILYTYIFMTLLSLSSNFEQSQDIFK